MILNLTQHTANPDQVSAGVVEPVDKPAVKALLTFDEPPTRREIVRRAIALAEIARLSGAKDAMIGGAGYLMEPLETALSDRGIRPRHSFSVRASMESVRSDGSTVKVGEFRHIGWAPTD